MEETNKRFEERTDRYRQNFKKYGYSEMSMDMPSDRRVIRYYELLKYFEFFQSPKTEPAFTLCDAGCGFGDINGYLQKLGFQDYSYIGLDVVDEFMEEGRKHYGSDRIRYLKRNFTTDDISDLEFDYAVSSQTFTIPYTEKPDNYETIFSSVENCLNSAAKGCLSTFSRIKASSSVPVQPIMIRWRSCGSRILYPPM